MAKNQNTFEKRRREIEKKWKAEQKRERRRRRKDESAELNDAKAPSKELEEPSAD